MDRRASVAPSHVEAVETPASLGRWGPLAVGVLLGVAMLVGTFFDYEISAGLLDEGSRFGVIMAAFGWYPALWVLSSAGSLLVVVGLRKGRAGPFLAVSGSAMVIGAVGAGAIVPQSYWESATGETLSMWLTSGVSILLNGAVVLGSVALSRRTESGRVLQVAGVLLFVLVAQVAAIYLIKVLWLRPRMLLVAEDLGVPYEPWWHAGFSDLQYWLDAGVPKDDFKSFPSAHTGNAASALALAQVVALHERGRRWVTPVFLTGFVLALAVALSRIVVGAHFLTDTAVAIALVLALLLISAKAAAQMGARSAPRA